MEKVKVLVIDDTDLIRALLVHVLEMDANIKCIEAVDGSHALRILAKEEVNLIICDVLMRPMDGLEFFEKLRASGNNTRFIFMTGDGDFGPKERQIINRADEFFIKPFDISKIEGFRDKILRALAN